MQYVLFFGNVALAYYLITRAVRLMARGSFLAGIVLWALGVIILVCAALVLGM